jgi:hypothetical protein
MSAPTPEPGSSASIEARLTALEQRQAVLDALHAYSKAIDLGDQEAWVGCFTADGAFDIRSHLPDYPAARHEGAAQLRVFIAGHSAPPAAFHKHLYVDPEIEIRGDTARAVGYFVHLVDRDERPVLLSYGRYLDQLHRCEDGRWRLVERIAEVHASDGSAQASRR